jgi:hypothetical protein
MATINSQIILSGAGITSEPLLINHTSTLVVRNPAIESGTLNVTTTAATLVPTNASKVYLYARNTGAINTADSINIKTIGFCGFRKNHPHDDYSTIRLGYNEPVDKTNIINNFYYVIDLSIELYNKILRQF